MKPSRQVPAGSDHDADEKLGLDRITAYCILTSRSKVPSRVAPGKVNLPGSMHHQVLSPESLGVGISRAGGSIVRRGC